MKVEPRRGTFITISVSPLILFPMTILNGDIAHFNSLTPLTIAVLGLAGLFNFVLGRTLMYAAVKAIGATRAGPLQPIQTPFAAVIGFFLLLEPLEPNTILGISLTILGVSLISLSEKGVSNQLKIGRKILIKGITFGLMGSLFWGTSTALGKLGLVNLSSPLLGTLVSAVFGVIFYTILIGAMRIRIDFRGIDKNSLSFLLASGLVSCLGYLFMFVSLTLTTVAVTATMLNFDPLIALVLAYFFLRKTDVINIKVIAGAVLVVLGAYIVAV